MAATTEGNVSADQAAVLTAAQQAASQAAAAAVAAQSAASTATQAAAQTGAGQTDVSAGYRSGGAEVTSDIGQAEAYMLNMKKLVADELDHAANLRNIALEALRRSQRNGEDYDQTLRNIAVQAVQSAVSLQNRVSNGSTDLDTRIKQNSVDHDGRVRGIVEGEVSRTVRHSDLAIDRQWNIDEVAAAIAKNPVFQDAIAGAVAAAVQAGVSAGAANK